MEILFLAVKELCILVVGMKKKKSNSRYKDWRIGSGSEHYVVSHKKIMAVKRFLGLGEKMLGFDCKIGFCRFHAGFEELITNQTWI